MRFLANENFPVQSIRILRKAGFSVQSILETSPGISDHQVIAKAVEDKSIILTFDKDYGEIIFRNHFPTPPAVIFFRSKRNRPESMLATLIESGKYEFTQSFTVIENEGVRQRKY